MTTKLSLLTKSNAVVRFAGDSGDGMQLIGDEWVKAVGEARNDLATLPDFPAEIRAPAGTLAGVSGFQIQFASVSVFTPGDRPDVLIALNPAALKANIADLKPGGTIIANESAFSDISLSKAGFTSNPLTDQSLADFRVIAIDMSGILRTTLNPLGLGAKDIQKCKNFFCLGLLYWLYALDPKREITFIEDKFKLLGVIKDANILALKAGYAYGENTESLPEPCRIEGAPLQSGTYRALTGNKALALGLVTAGIKADLPLVYASYPITPASDILHELARLRAYGANTFQMEDEMAAICAAIGASYAGSLGATATSGPGFALKAEALGYATMVELPLIVIDVQRAGPSTGMPTKTEQSDLMQAVYGRSGEAPVPVLAALSPTDCFDVALDAVRVAINFMTPVIILSDAFIANSSAPWLIKDPSAIEPIVKHHEPYSLPFKPYERNAQLARAWVTPGRVETIYQLGGLEKDALMGSVSYDAKNHQTMTETRAKKIEGVKHMLPAPEIFGADEGEILLIGFGGTFGSLRQATKTLMAANKRVSHLHIRLVNPLHDEIGTMMDQFDKVMVAEHNLGQLKNLLQAKFARTIIPLNKVSGKPFLVSEICDAVTSHVATYVPRTVSIEATL